MYTHYNELLLTINQREYFQSYYNQDKIIEVYLTLQTHYRCDKVLYPNLCLISQQTLLRERNLMKGIMSHHRLSITKSSFHPRFWVTNLIKLQEEEDNQTCKNRIKVNEQLKNNDVRKLLLDNDSSIDSIEILTTKLSYEYDKMKKRKQHSRNNSENVRLNYKNVTEKLNHHADIEKITANHPKISLVNPQIKYPSKKQVISKGNTNKPLFRSTQSFIIKLREKERKEKDLKMIYKEMVNSVKSISVFQKFKNKSTFFKIPSIKCPINKTKMKAFSIKGKFPSLASYSSKTIFNE